MKENYEGLMMEVIRFENQEDVLTSSGDIVLPEE